METPESIERMLEKRLVPRALSGEGSVALEELIDELSGETPQPSVKWGRYVFAAAAAAVLMFAAIVISIPSNERSPVAEVDSLFSDPREVVLIEDVEGVVSAEESDGFLADSDGSLHRAWLMQVVSEERFHDEQSGQEVRVVSPRDELVLMPVTSF